MKELIDELNKQQVTIEENNQKETNQIEETIFSDYTFTSVQILYKDNVEKNKIGKGLTSCLGLIKKDKEFEVIEDSLKRGWKEWSKKYV